MWQQFHLPIAGQFMLRNVSSIAFISAFYLACYATPVFACSWRLQLIDQRTKEIKHYAPGATIERTDVKCTLSKVDDDKDGKFEGTDYSRAEFVDIECDFGGGKSFASTAGAFYKKGGQVHTEVVRLRVVDGSGAFSLKLACN